MALIVAERRRAEEAKAPPPFLKWAGGKRWLVPLLADILPSRFHRYFEPFLGSGAVFFHLRPDAAVLSDLNAELIHTYRCVRADWMVILSLLEKHQRQHSPSYYYRMRRLMPTDPFERAARFIYLNRTCWNGLYRVNLRGEFNVPIGTKMSVILPADDFESAAEALRHAKLLDCDFEEIIQLAGKGDFVYVDPPYTVNHKFNGFLKYNENLFQWQDQIRLRDCLLRSKCRGAKILVSNADHASVRRLYRGMGELISLARNSVIAGDSSCRGRRRELVIKCY